VIGLPAAVQDADGGGMQMVQGVLLGGAGAHAVGLRDFHDVGRLLAVADAIGAARDVGGARPAGPHTQQRLLRKCHGLIP